jgi:hypothetical protein
MARLTSLIAVLSQSWDGTGVACESWIMSEKALGTDIHYIVYIYMSFDFGL